MRERVRIGVSVGRDHVGDWRQIAGEALGPLSPTEVKVYPFGFGYFFDRYPDGIEEIRSVLKAQGIDSTVSVRREYNPDELLTAEFLDFGTEDVVSSVAGTLRWDSIPLCAHCGFQETRWNFQTLAIEDQATRYRLAMVDWHPKVVSAPLADELRSYRFSGLDLVPVGQKRSPDWYALQPRHTLGPLQSPPTRLDRLASATPLCERNHNWERPNSEFHYRRENFNGLDFNRSYELFGAPQSHAPALVVSNRLYRRLVELGVRQLACEPIRLLD